MSGEVGGQCMDCKWWAPEEGQGNRILRPESRVGLCKRYPPQLLYRQAAIAQWRAPVFGSEMRDKVDPEVVQAQPEVLGGDRCGEYAEEGDRNRPID